MFWLLDVLVANDISLPTRVAESFDIKQADKEWGWAGAAENGGEADELEGAV